MGKSITPSKIFESPAKPKFTFIDLFAGIGGFRLAMQKTDGEYVFCYKYR